MTTSINIDSAEFNGLTMAADWIQDLESSDSRLHKESVIEKALIAAKLGSTSAQCFLYNCYQAYNPYYVFGVRQVPETDGLIDRANPWPRFWALLESLRTRSVTGHAARDAIAEVSQQFDSEEWNGMCRRVLIKDLRCGISEKTLNKVLGKTEWKIPTFTCQLAQDSTDHPAKMTGQKRLEGKLDGVRVLALATRSGVNLYSRNGKPFDNFPQIAAALEAIADQFVHSTYGADMRIVFDGEIVGQSFQDLMRQAQRKRDVDTSDMVYHIFDWMPLAEFEEGHCNTPQRRRTEWLETQRGLIESQPTLAVTTGITVDLDVAEGHDQLQRYAEDAVAAGLEGIMIKDLAAPYECRRSSSWMKWKPTITVDLAIVGFEEGTGRNAGRLGAIVCEGTDNGKLIGVNVGSGLSDLQRDQYWLNRNSLLGQVVEVQADAVTQNQDSTYSLRFPRFVRFRGFEPGEKL
jgi:DNA ligase-1